MWRELGREGYNRGKRTNQETQETFRVSECPRAQLWVSIPTIELSGKCISEQDLTLFGKCISSQYPQQSRARLPHPAPQSTASKCHEPLPVMQRATLNTLRGPYSLNPHDVHSCSPSQGQARSAPYMAPHSRRTAPCRYQTCQSCRLQARAACHYGRGHGDGSLVLHAEPKGGARGISIAERGAIWQQGALALPPAKLVARRICAEFEARRNC
jgi:hypothetical protein